MLNSNTLHRFFKLICLFQELLNIHFLDINETMSCPNQWFFVLVKEVFAQ